MMRPSGSLISYFSNRAKNDGGLNLAQGIPGFPPPPELLKILEEISTNRNYHQYPPGTGNFRLLEQIQRHIPLTTPLSPERLLIVQGATEGIFLSFLYLSSLINRSFSVLSFDPAYESYPKLAEILHHPFLYMDLNSALQVDMSALEDTVREKNVGLICLSSPGNPLGKAWSRAEMSELLTLADKYDFYIIYDAVYKEIYFNTPPFNPLELNNPRLFYVDSFSKMLSITGWRIGWLAAAPFHMEKIRAMHDFTGLCAPAPLQEAIARYLEKYDQGASYVPVIRKKTQQAFSVMSRELKKLGFHTPPIDGGYFIWAQLPPAYPDGLAFAMQLYEKVKLAVVPGENFSMTKKEFIRINIATETDMISQAVQRLKSFFS